MGGFNIGDFVSALVINMVVWLFSVSFHEAAHAWMSYKYGDDTAYMLGRVTLNPVPHIDPVGTILLPIIGFFYGYFGTGGVAVPLIMWGKPTPVNPLKWRKKDQANVMVSLAGIGVNLIIATAFAIVFRVLSAYDIFTRASVEEGFTKALFTLVISMVIMNVGLAIFNLLPFPPLDGSKALQSFLPRSAEPLINVLETYGFLILIVLMQMGVISFLVRPVSNFILNLLLVR